MILKPTPPKKRLIVNGVIILLLLNAACGPGLIPCPDFEAKNNKPVKIKRIQTKRNVNRSHSAHLHNRNVIDSVLSFDTKPNVPVYASTGSNVPDLALSKLPNDELELDHHATKAQTLKSIRQTVKSIRTEAKKQKRAVSGHRIKEEGIQTNPWAIAGFATSIASVFFWPLCILGIVFSAIAIGQIKKFPDKYKGKGLATAGLIIGIVIAALGLIVLLIVASLLAELNN